MTGAAEPCDIERCPIAFVMGFGFHLAAVFAWLFLDQPTSQSGCGRSVRPCRHRIAVAPPLLAGLALLLGVRRAPVFANVFNRQFLRVRHRKWLNFNAFAQPSGPTITAANGTTGAPRQRAVLACKNQLRFQTAQPLAVAQS